MSHYFSNVGVFDGRTVKTKQGVHVAGGTIQWVGPHARAPRVARAASEVEGNGRTLTPGLIDCHVHLAFDGGRDFAGEAVGLTAAKATIKATRNVVRHLEHGVTTVCDLGSVGSAMCEVGKAIDEGLITGARTLAAGQALTVTGGTDTTSP
jgi:imidazolonepropionase-like amidohydrolase